MYSSEFLERLGGPSREALEHFIYVSGSARGGTTIVTAAIGMHPEILTTTRPSHFLNHVWRYRKVLHDRLWRQLLWTPPQYRRRAVRDSLPTEKRESYLRLINLVSAERKLDELYAIYALTLALDPDTKTDPSTYRAWMDKGNDFWGIDELPAAFPNGRFIFVIRDPRGAVLSLAKRSSEMREDTRFSVEPCDIITTAIYWRNLVMRQRRFARRYPEQAVFLRFEDFTTEPIKMLQAVYSELGLKAMSEREISKGLDEIFYSTSNDKLEEGKGIRTTPNERWKDRLGPFELRLINRICGRTARALGMDFAREEKQMGWLELLGHVPGNKAKLIVAAKLMYLEVLDRTAVGISPFVRPLVTHRT